jgi:prephenate dehydrogenase
MPSTESEPDSFTSFGIVGYGHFGQFLARSLAARGINVVVTDTDAAKLPPAANGVRATSLNDVAGSDVVVLAIPAAALESVLGELSDRLDPSTVVMDVVSTKAHATELLESLLRADQNLLATHPLFGPPSMDLMQPGDRLVVTAGRGARAEALALFLEHTLGLRLISVPAEEHDRAMAYMQALPFFIARALDRLDIDHFRDDLEIPSFHKLAEIANIERHHSAEMFETSQLSNPYAREAREHFLDILQKLNTSLQETGGLTLFESAGSELPSDCVGERDHVPERFV